MGLPSHRHTSSRRDRRRAHHALGETKILTCAKCKAPILSHQVCKTCGNYNGRVVLAIKAKKTKNKK